METTYSLVIIPMKTQFQHPSVWKFWSPLVASFEDRVGRGSWATLAGQQVTLTWTVSFMGING